MSTLRIKIDQQLAQIGVNNTPAKMNISLPRVQMRVRTEAAQMEVDRQAPTFKVNRRKINDESGLKAPLAFAKDFSGKGRQAALRGIGQNSRDGDFLANPDIPGKEAVPRLAKSKAMSRLASKKEINIGLMPESSPEIQWDKGHMRINWSRHSVVIDWEGDYLPEMTVDPKHSVEVFLRTQPYFRVMVEESLDSGRPGKYIDSAV